MAGDGRVAGVAGQGGPGVMARALTQHVAVDPFHERLRQPDGGDVDPAHGVAVFQPAQWSCRQADGASVGADSGRVDAVRRASILGGGAGRGVGRGRSGVISGAGARHERGQGGVEHLGTELGAGGDGGELSRQRPLGPPFDEGCAPQLEGGERHHEPAQGHQDLARHPGPAGNGQIHRRGGGGGRHRRPGARAGHGRAGPGFGGGAGEGGHRGPCRPVHPELHRGPPPAWWVVLPGPPFGLRNHGRPVRPRSTGRRWLVDSCHMAADGGAGWVWATYRGARE